MLKQIIKNNWLVFLLLTILVFIVYTNALPNEFTSDDTRGILNNQTIGQYRLSSFGFLTTIIKDTIFHIAHLNPWPYRLFNILSHLGCVFLSFIILLILTNKKTVAILAAALFAVHPILDRKSVV